MSLLYMTTTSSQSILASGIVPLTTISRRKGCAIQSSGNNIILNKAGYYNVSGSVTLTGTTTGNATISLYKNGVQVSGINATETIGTSSTEAHTLAISGVVRVLCSEDSASLSLVNTGVGVTISNVSLVVSSIE